jgi:hypothetical protein
MQQGKQQPQHQPADGPAFWNITHNFKPGELESDLSKMFFNQALDLHKENEALKQHIKRLEEALESIREYWSRDNNNRALVDACWYAIDTASEALEAKEAKP